jgi:hypothetical protein
MAMGTVDHDLDALAGTTRLEAAFAARAGTEVAVWAVDRRFGRGAVASCRESERGKRTGGERPQRLATVRVRREEASQGIEARAIHNSPRDAVTKMPETSCSEPTPDVNRD